MYVTRYTDNPEADLKRGWSGFMGVAWNTAYEAARSLLVNGDANLDEEEIENLNEDELLSLLDAHNFDVRFDEQFGTYRHVHHTGLSCWRLAAETLEDAIDEAQHTGSWSGFGDATIGTLRYVCAVPGTNDQHIFECDAVTAE